jgi:hypothetical protein
MTELVLGEKVVDFSDYRTHIEAALGFAGDTHSAADVAAMIEAGHAHFWPGPSSVVVTEFHCYPRRKVLHFWLAAGNAHELAQMEPVILGWGKRQGCTQASLVGRKGWTRSFLTASSGWTVSPLVLMEKAL